MTYYENFPENILKESLKTITYICKVIYRIEDEFESPRNPHNLQEKIINARKI
jgi:hypothetical protein